MPKYALSERKKGTVSNFEICSLSLFSIGLHPRREEYRTRIRFTSTLPGFMSPNNVENNSTAPTQSPAQPSSYPNTVPNNGGLPSANPSIMPSRINP